MRALPPVVQARRDSNPQPPVLETGALPVELRTPARTTGHPPAGEPVDGQGRNRTADTAIFSRVLYQLSYLAKKTPEPFGAGGWVGISPGLPASPASPPARARPRIGRKPVERPHAACPLESRRSTRFACFQHGSRLRSRTRLRVPQTGLLRGKRRPAAALPSSGGGIRTRDLRVMSPTSYQTAPPRNKKRKVKRSREACQAEVYSRPSAANASGSPSIPAAGSRPSTRAMKG